MKKIPMTLSGAEKLRKELSYLKNIRRPEISKNISVAREYGDLKENAEYHAAREQQGFCEGRIQEIECKLYNAFIIDITKVNPSDKVIFGSTVYVRNLDIFQENYYRIVGDDEANIKEHMISINSPLARGLIGNKKGDVVKIITPKGPITYKIIQVKYE